MSYAGYMAFEDYRQKSSVTIVYTGESKGKTSASLGLLMRALGNRWSVAYLQFIKYWGVGEHIFLRDIQDLYKKKLYVYRGGKGFYHAGELSATNISDKEHKESAKRTFEEAKKSIVSHNYNLVICDEISNAVNDGLIKHDHLKTLLLLAKEEEISLCLTGRNFPTDLLDYVDIATNMTKIKHHFDDKFLANKGIDY